MADLNPEQLAAVAGIREWLATSPRGSMAWLTGPAGTGKTFCVAAVARDLEGSLVYTAPTNKATKVLADTMRQAGEAAQCRTTYSLLGLRLEPNGEVRELTVPEDPIDLSDYKLILVDEGSMVNAQLFEHLEAAAASSGVRVLFLADEYQLPPVKEQRSRVFDVATGWRLRQIMRHGGPILETVTIIRKAVDAPFRSFDLKASNNGLEGVWNSPIDFWRMMEAEIESGGFLRPNGAKAIAWRNVRVDDLNLKIRTRLFDAPEQFTVGDRVIFTAPAAEGEGDARIMLATTDDEGTVTGVSAARHPLYSEFMCWRLDIMLDHNVATHAWVLQQQQLPDWNRRCEALAATARGNRRKWPDFWAFKEAFHAVRWAYAITAHRSQGSTYDTAFVDWYDILRSPDRVESLKCLYVAASRARRRLVLGK